MFEVIRFCFEKIKRKFNFEHLQQAKATHLVEWPTNYILTFYLTVICVGTLYGILTVIHPEFTSFKSHVNHKLLSQGYNNVMLCKATITIWVDS